MKSGLLPKREYINTISDCVYIEPTIKTRNGRATVLFTIVFGEHLDTTISIGELRFGIRRGELRLTIENGKISPKDIEFLNQFTPKLRLAVEDSASDSSSATEKTIGTVKGNYGLSPSIESTMESQAEIVAQTGAQRRISYSEDTYFIRANWDATHPRWEFYSHFLDKMLHGIVEQLKFAAITIESEPLVMKYSFHVKSKDVLYGDVPLFSKTDNVNKRRILHALLTKIVLGSQNIVSSGAIVL